MCHEESQRGGVKGVLEVGMLEKHSKYLGLPSSISRRKIGIFPLFVKGLV